MARKRIFLEGQGQELLTIAGECRRECIKVRGQAPIGGPVYQAVGELMEAIDALRARLLTGVGTHRGDRGWRADPRLLT